jgi:hypothetical protein
VAEDEPGWKRASDCTADPGAIPHGDPRPGWDPNHAAFDPERVDPGAETIWRDAGAPYGRGPGGVPYTKQQYTERFHTFDRHGMPDMAWPPNQGAVAGTKWDYTDVYQFVLKFGDRVDRLGHPKGTFFAVMENGLSASYESRALPYDSLYQELHTYTLIPGKLPKGWKIRVMDTAPAFGQPGGSLALIFYDDKGNKLSAEQLTDPRIGVLRDDR